MSAASWRQRDSATGPLAPGPNLAEMPDDPVDAPGEIRDRAYRRRRASVTGRARPQQGTRDRTIPPTFRAPGSNWVASALGPERADGGRRCPGRPKRSVRRLAQSPARSPSLSAAPREEKYTAFPTSPIVIQPPKPAIRRDAALLSSFAPGAGGLDAAAVALGEKDVAAGPPSSPFAVSVHHLRAAGEVVTCQAGSCARELFSLLPREHRLVRPLRPTEHTLRSSSSLRALWNMRRAAPKDNSTERGPRPSTPLPLALS